MAELIVNLIEGVNGEARAAMVFVLIGCTTAILITTVVTIAATIAKVVRSRVEAELKRDMLDRGLSAEEIATVISATGAPSEESGHATKSVGCCTPVARAKAG